MKNKYLYLLLLLSGLWFYSCSEDSSMSDTYNDAVIDNPDNPYKFNQLIFIIKLKIDGKSVLVKQIDSIKIKVNDKLWGVYTSNVIDTSGIKYQIINNLKVSERDVSYQIIAPYQLIINTKLTTAGEFSDLLKNRLVLSPGGHLCNIYEMWITDENNNQLKINPFIYQEFTVYENISSIIAGRLTVNIE